MKIIAPDYYNEFSCIASACRYSCCIGWEIEVDEKSLNYYKSINGVLGEKLSAAIDETVNPPMFRLDARERCPFLQQDGLCELICKLGDESLCNICRDHPRFRNFYSDRTEIGLGLCCEAAAQLIINNTRKAKLVTLSDDGANQALDDEELFILGLRSKLIAAAQDRRVDIGERIGNVLRLCGAKLPERKFSSWADLLFNMERLNPEWENELVALKSAESVQWNNLPMVQLEQILVYFLYRHVPNALEGYDVRAVVAFAAVSTQLIAAIFAGGSQKDLWEIARMYSCEIEYSDENTDDILTELENEQDY